MSVYGDFKDTIASYANRGASLFTTTGGLDLILLAMNDARRQAQRDYTFNMLRQYAFCQLSMLPVSMLTDFDADDSGSGALVVVKRIESLWEYGIIVINATNAYYPTKQIDLRSMATLEFAVPQKPWPWQQSDVTTTPTFAYLQGNRLFHSNLSTPTWTMADVIAFLPDHDGGAGTDIFLTYFKDWLKFATMANLNLWLKASDRFSIDETVMTRLYNSMTTFDAQQSQMGTISLD